MQQAFSLEKRATIRTLRTPTLILRPNVSKDSVENFAALANAIDESGLASSHTYVNQDVFGPTGKKSSTPQERKVISFKPRIIEGTREMSLMAGDNSRSILRDRILAVHERRIRHQEGTDRDSYAMLIMQSLLDGKPIDAQTCTVLDDDPALKGDIVPGGDSSGGRVDFAGLLADLASGFARFRRSVGGVVLRS